MPLSEATKLLLFEQCGSRLNESNGFPILERETMPILCNAQRNNVVGRLVARQFNVSRATITRLWLLEVFPIEQGEGDQELPPLVKINTSGFETSVIAFVQPPHQQQTSLVLGTSPVKIYCR